MTEDLSFKVLSTPYDSPSVATPLSANPADVFPSTLLGPKAVKLSRVKPKMLELGQQLGGAIYVSPRNRYELGFNVTLSNMNAIDAFARDAAREDYALSYAGQAIISDTQDGSTVSVPVWNNSHVAYVILNNTPIPLVKENGAWTLSPKKRYARKGTDVSESVTDLSAEEVMLIKAQRAKSLKKEA